MGFAQYAGPAILSRGEAPAAMEASQISFRPHVEFLASYGTGLSGIILTSNGTLANANSAGIMTAWGISGAHSWRHTKVGLEYRGDLSHYTQQSYYDTIDQVFYLGLSHQFSRHTILRLRESAGTFTRNFTLPGLDQSLPFDPITSYIPTTDFFDNRTMYLTTQADFTIQKSARLSLNIGGDGFINRRRSTALAGVIGAAARGDAQYRLTSRTTVGLSYQYMHLDFTRIFGGTDLQGLTGGYSVRLNRFLEFSGYGGAMRVESKFIQEVPIDPMIAALLGIRTGTGVAHTISTVPSVGGRLSRTYSKGVAYLSGGHGITPGNGLFLTSYTTNATLGYTYTGLRRWSFSVGVGYNVSRSTGTISGNYSNSMENLTITRQIRQGFHFTGQAYWRRYSSGDYAAYNRSTTDIRVGVGFAPGDVPLRVW
jgi:hypothetical protein